MGKENYTVEHPPSQRLYNGNVYHPAPAMPKLEISINQHNPSPIISPYQVSNVQSPSPPSTISKRNPPTVSPPPIPNAPPRNPNYTSTYNYVRSDAGGFFIDKFPKRENRGMFRLCLIEFLLALFVFFGGVWCFRENALYCPYYSAIWTGMIFLLNSIVGSIASKMGTHNLYIAHLVLSVASVILCIIGCILSARNWMLIGTYRHPTVGPYDSFCVIDQHDSHRISYIFSHQDKYNFRQCLWMLKAGLATNSVQFVVTAVLAILNLVSAAFCLRRTCRKH
jgi:hypothetical protein